MENSACVYALAKDILTFDRFFACRSLSTRCAGLLKMIRTDQQIVEIV